MSSYSTVGANDLPTALAFYDGLLGSTGWTKLFDHPRGGRLYRKEGGKLFGVLAPANGESASVGNGTMVGFACDSPEEVSALHAKAMELGGTDEGAPGNRGSEEMPTHFGYFRDPEGNKLCAFWFGSRKA